MLNFRPYPITTAIRSGRFQSWEGFCLWVTSTNNSLYAGWFGVLMIPCLLAATICFIVAFIAGPPRRYRRHPGSRCRFADVWQQHHHRCCDPLQQCHRPALLPDLGTASIDEWLYIGGPYQLVVFHFLIGISAYLGRQWELSYRLGMRPRIFEAKALLFRPPSPCP